jgi:hypothetical protein
VFSDAECRRLFDREVGDLIADEIDDLSTDTSDSVSEFRLRE